MERLLQNTPATISNTFYEDGVAVDPGTVTIGITRADGSELVAAGTATAGTGAAARTYNLTAAAHTTLLDTLKATWTSTTKGAMVTYVEVGGGFLFSLTELDGLLQSPSTYTAAQKAAARVRAETALEDACGVAFVPRYRYETLNGSGTTSLLLARSRVRSIRSASVDDAEITDTLTPLADGAIYYASGWTAGFGNTVIGYEHGYDFPPPRVGHAAAMLAKHYLVKGPIDDRATSETTDLGTISLLTPGLRGSIFGLPEVDVTVQEYGVNAGVG